MLFKQQQHKEEKDEKGVKVWGRGLKLTTIILLPLFLLPSQSSSSLISCWSLLQSSSTCVVHPLRFSCCSSWISKYADVVPLHCYYIRLFLLPSAAAGTSSCSISKCADAVPLAKRITNSGVFQTQNTPIILVSAQVSVLPSPSVTPTGASGNALYVHVDYPVLLKVVFIWGLLKIWSMLVFICAISMVWQSPLPYRPHFPLPMFRQ